MNNKKSGTFIDKHGDTVNIFRCLHRLINTIGESELKDRLETMLTQANFDNENTDYIIEYILNIVCEAFVHIRLNKSDLFKYKKRHDYTTARKIAILLIKHHTNASDKIIAGFFGGRSRITVWKINKEWNVLDPENKEDMKFISIYNALSYKVKKFILERKEKVSNISETNTSAS